MFSQYFGRAALLPRREAARLDRRQARYAAISLQKMSSENQAELIKSKDTWPILRPNKWESAFGQLRDDQVILTDRKFIALNGLDIVIPRNLVETLARQMIVHIVKPAIHEAHWVRLQVNDA